MAYTLRDHSEQNIKQILEVVRVIILMMQHTILEMTLKDCRILAMKIVALFEQPFKRALKLRSDFNRNSDIIRYGKRDH